MKMLLTILLLAGTTAAGFSQSNTMLLPGNIPGAKYAPQKKESSDVLFLQKLRDGNKAKETARTRIKIDSLVAIWKGSQKQSSSIDNMPNATTVQSFPSSNDIFKGNNREGFDIYESRIDRIPVLKPDSLNNAQLIRRK